MKLKESQIGFVGAGNMAGSLIRGILQQGCPPANVTATDIDAKKLEVLNAECGINTGGPDRLTDCSVIVLAVKPQVMQRVCSSLPASRTLPLYISVAAGITLDQLGKWLGEDTAIVRCMPNTPALVGQGASGMHAGTGVSAAQKELAADIMGSVGLSLWMPQESDLDLVTAVSGSGPAYFFLFMEAMEQAARDLGMPEETAHALVLQTASGAAELARQSEVGVEELRRRVTSPGGTTERAIASLEENGIRQLLKQALVAARDRSIELARESSN